jgi:hypothetical protein
VIKGGLEAGDRRHFRPAAESIKLFTSGMLPSDAFAHSFLEEG